jgi:hypothetical protein
MYLPFGNHPRAWIQNGIQSFVYVLLLEFLFWKIDNEVQFSFLAFFPNLDHKFLFMK